MKKLWIKLADRFDALPPRERFAVFLGLTALLLGVAYRFGFEPLLVRQQEASRSLEASRKSLALLAEQEVLLIGAASHDPDAAARNQLQQIAEENTRLRETLGKTKLATPEQMIAVLRDLIAAQKGLTLIGLRAQEPTPFRPAAAAVPDAPGLYRHGIEITVRGAYPDLMRYVQQIEALPWPVRPGRLDLKTETYPESTMTLTLYTLSLERAWLGF
jgi:MSHA biogenesis protein MshJ